MIFVSSEPKDREAHKVTNIYAVIEGGTKSKFDQNVKNLYLLIPIRYLKNSDCDFHVIEFFPSESCQKVFSKLQTPQNISMLLFFVELNITLKTEKK